MSSAKTRRRRRRAGYAADRAWDAEGVRALRRHLGLTQEELSERLGMRQQTVSEWELGKHRPQGASRTLLSVIAEAASFTYAPATVDSQAQQQAADPEA
jgi:putative transcriptional regulator